MPRPSAAIRTVQPVAKAGTPWPTGIRDTDRHHTLVRFSGDLDEMALAEIRVLCPGRHVTRCGPEIVVWPLGTTWVSHASRATILRGRFDGRDVDAVRAAHPGRTVSRDGELITVWPMTPAGFDGRAHGEDPR